MKRITGFLLTLLATLTLAEGRIGLVYEVQHGDTLQNVADRFIGGDADKVRTYNQLTNDTLVFGQHVILPGDEDALSVLVIDWAAEAVTRAKDKHQAHKYAVPEYRGATEALAASRSAYATGDFSQANRLAQLAHARALHAIEVAEENARPQQAARVTFARGGVSISKDSKDWAELQTGTSITAPTYLRTSVIGRAEVTMADGTILQVREFTKIQIVNSRLDLRDDHRESELNVLVGAVLATVAVQPHERTEFEIVTWNTRSLVDDTRLLVDVRDDEDLMCCAKRGSCGTRLFPIPRQCCGHREAIRGISMFVHYPDEQRCTRCATWLEDRTLVTRLSVKDGYAELSANQVDFRFGDNEGVVVAGYAAPMDPVALPIPPDVTVPDMSPKKAADMTYLFEWIPAIDYGARAYHVEVGNDDRLNDTVSEGYDGNHTNHFAGVLPVGHYYWRICGVDKRGLEGRESLGELDVYKETTLEFHAEGEVVHEGGRWIVGPENRVVLRPLQYEDNSVIALHMRVDDGIFRHMNDGMSFPREGAFVLQGKAVSPEKDFGATVSQSIIVDLTAPTVSTATGPVRGDVFTGRAVEVRLSAEDMAGVAHIEYAIGANELAPYQGPFDVELSRHGIPVRYRATDRVGNTSMIATQLFQ